MANLLSILRLKYQRMMLVRAVPMAIGTRTREEIPINNLHKM
jgi:hypothetical protein